MSNYIQSGNEIRVYGEGAVSVSKTLPVGNYAVRKDVRGLYLERINDFTVPSKLYGKTEFYANRILATYKDRLGNTGVLLSGEKGSGKTMLARKISHLAAQEGIPTITINEDWSGDEFNRLIQAVEQPCVLIFDEFEKVYNSDKQNEVLTLFDGVYQTKKLIILTCNDRWSINQHMRNRPGRLYYMLEFKGLDNAFITDYCNHELKDKKHIDAICTVAGMFVEFNFDMLKSMVEELNRYGETPIQVLEMLNAKPGGDEYVMFNLELWIDGARVAGENMKAAEWRGIPMGKTIIVHYNATGAVAASDPNDPHGFNDKEGDNNDSKAVFDDRHLKQVDIHTGNFVYEDGNKRLVMIRQRRTDSAMRYLLA